MKTDLLVVSNNPKKIAKLTEIIKKGEIDVKVYYTRNPVKAMKVILSKGIKIVVCDFDMKLSEILISEIRIRSPLCGVVTVTEKPGMARIIAALDIGAWDYISEPLSNVKDFLTCINSAVSRVKRWENGMLFSKETYALTRAKKESLPAFNNEPVR